MNQSSAQLLHFLMPLHYFYEKNSLTLPRIEIVDAADLPEIAQKLLVHDRDMTSTLAHFFHSPMELEVVTVEGGDSYLLREVVLRTEENLPVEYGAIGIGLDAFSPALREAVLLGQQPLGALLEEHQFPFVSNPRAYFSVVCDSHIAQSLEVPPKSILFGRSNVLSTPDGIAFADIVEILSNQPGAEY